MLVLGAAAALSLGSSKAEAFCRSSTCKGAECTLDEDGCPADGKKLFWASSCVGFSFDDRFTVKLDPIKARKSIESAFFEWSSLDCIDGSGMADMRFVELDDVSCRVSSYNSKAPNVNIVLFQDDSWRYRGEDNTLAKTTVTFDPSSGEILDADIEINTAINPVTVRDPVPGPDGTDPKVQYDLQSLMTHEIGHFLGIAHSPYPDATMFASYSPGSTDLRTISDDDRDALCAIYPPARAAVCAPTPRGGLLTDCAAVPQEAPKEKSCSVRAVGSERSSVMPFVSCVSAFFLLRRMAQRRRIAPSPS